MTLQGVIYLALSPIRTPLAAMLGTAGGSFEEGLNAGAPSISRIRNTLRTMLRSPVLSVLVVFEAALTLALWVGVVAAFLRCTRAKPEYRLWVFYLAAAGVLLLALAAGGEADARFRAPVIPLLAIVAALGYFPGSRLQEAQPAEVPGRVAMVA
jgi:hypothetical protein